MRLMPAPETRAPIKWGWSLECGAPGSFRPARAHTTKRNLCKLRLEGWLYPREEGLSLAGREARQRLSHLRVWEQAPEAVNY
jgi:hypothetical protein